jgi:hypothetical protein
MLMGEASFFLLKADDSRVISLLLIILAEALVSSRHAAADVRQVQDFIGVPESLL